jgi:chemotaxis protein methyltransferase CheR
MPEGGSELSTESLAFVEELVRNKIAVQLTGKAYLIESRLAPVARLHKLESLEELVRKLKLRSDPRLQSDVIDAMTTNETSFFRDRHPFDALGNKILPRILENTSSPSLTVWNAACSSGQEPLSLAMVLHEKFPQLVASQRVKIVATDISPAMIDRTKRGIYSRFEINRGLPANYTTKYFKQTGRDWQAKSELLDMLDVRSLNLIEQWPGMPACDVVMIRNVLIYFSADVKRNILQRIATNVLKPGGFLFLGASESPVDLDNFYQAVNVDGTRVFVNKKRG